jgi:hypothetical protein
MLLLQKVYRSLCNIPMFWDMTPCSVVDGWQCFGGTCCLNMQCKMALFYTASHSRRSLRISNLIYRSIQFHVILKGKICYQTGFSKVNLRSWGSNRCVLHACVRHGEDVDCYAVIRKLLDSILSVRWEPKSPYLEHGRFQVFQADSMIKGTVWVGMKPGSRPNNVANTSPTSQPSVEVPSIGMSLINEWSNKEHGSLCEYSARTAKFPSSCIILISCNWKFCRLCIQSPLLANTFSRCWLVGVRGIYMMDFSPTNRTFFYFVCFWVLS